MMTYVLWAFLLVLGVVAWIVFGTARRSLFARRVERARRRFEEQRDACQKAFLEAAAASGKPRGLAWKKCDLDDKLLVARDRSNGELLGLVGATISFEAIEGGGMEEVEAVGNLRAATAVFTFDGRDWTTQGRAVFNLEPHEVLERYRDSLDPLS
ncbi:MAG: hypothetical protein WD669_10860 [Pirellulales bacterium]